MIRQVAVLALSAISLVTAGAASAIQFPLSGAERLHTVGSGEAGAQWNTGSTTAGGQISYDSLSGELHVSAVLNVLNFWDPTPGSGCLTDAGSNCQYNYSPDLDLTIEMELASIVAAPFAGPAPFDTVLTINFQSTADGIADYILVDPSDGTTLLEGDWQAGMFGGTPTTGVTATVLYDTGTGVASFGSGQVADTGFLAVDPSKPYATLVQSSLNEFFALNFTTIDNFDDGAGGGLNEIVGVAVATGALPDFTAEGQGQLFRVEDGGFTVPEPTTGLMFLLGMAGLGHFSRRVKRQQD